MTSATDDLTSVLVQPDREHTGYGQGILRSFDQETFENEVEYRGKVLTNLPVLSGPDALAYQGGDVVLIMKWTPTGKGLSSYWIAGRPVVPGSGRGAEVVAFLRGGLAKQIAAEVFASRIHANNAGGEQATNTTIGYQTLPGGPEVTSVDISETGRALVFLSAVIGDLKGPTNTPSIGGRMSFEITGATNQAPSNLRSVAVLAQITQAADLNLQLRQRMGTTVEVTGLNPGQHTFTALYTPLFSGQTVVFGDRTLSVIAF